MFNCFRIKISCTRVNSRLSSYEGVLDRRGLIPKDVKHENCAMNFFKYYIRSSAFSCFVVTEEQFCSKASLKPTVLHVFASQRL